MKDSLAFQKSRIMWLKLGDSNTSFFHACVNKRRRENTLHGIYSHGSWVEELNLVKECLFNHFEAQFNQSCDVRPALDNISFNLILASHLSMLIVEFSLEEIKAAVWGCDGNKTPVRTGTTST